MTYDGNIRSNEIPDIKSSETDYNNVILTKFRRGFSAELLSNIFKAVQCFPDCHCEWNHAPISLYKQDVFAHTPAEKLSL